MKNARSNKYAPEEEQLHVLTHGVAFLVSLIAGYLLLRPIINSGGSIGWITGYSLFVISMSLVFLTSTMYHYTKSLKRKLLFRKLDHMSIYLLIAGTNTPIVMHFVPHPLDFYYLGIIWSVALAGIIAKLFFYSLFKKIDLAYYVLMGALGGVVVWYCIDKFPSIILYALIAGGLCYLVGVLFYRMERLKYHHVIWHIWVINGAAFHFWAIWVIN